MKKEKELYMIGNAHIDPVWLWQWQEGFQEIKATFRSALDRMTEYDDFIFTASSASFYEWVEENDPAMFEEIRQRVVQGRWVIVGGWWIQPDCNAPCGESFVRQGLYGQNYFKEKFGVRAVTGYNVDSFGHHGNLPQLLKKCGMDNYVFMRPGRHEKGLEGETFLWRSADGSEVMAFRIPFEYCTWPEEIEAHVLRCAGEMKNPGTSAMCFYGVGNHGGGPTQKNLDSIQEMNQNRDMPKLKLSDPDTYFADVKKSGRALPMVSGELFHHSSGCYSVESEVKGLNRKAEKRLMAAEKMSVAAKRLVGHPYPALEYEKAWKVVLFNQFHDILAGTSLQAAYEDAREDYGYALHLAGRGLNSAIQAISWKIDIPMEEGMRPLVVFNQNAFAMKTEVEVESVCLKERTVLLDDKDQQIAFQLVQSQASCNGRCRISFIADLPAYGWRTYRLAVREKVKKFTDVISTQTSAENKWFQIAFEEETGYISSFVKKNDGTEYFLAPSAVPVVLRDESDTWSHGVRIFDEEIGRFHGVSVRRIESGPVKCVIRVTSEYHQSRMVQDFSIYKELDYVSVRTTVDWHEKWAMLKLAFSMNMNYLRTSWETPYGVTKREPDAEEYPMQTWLDLEGTNPGMDTRMNGMTLLCDNKFSGSVKGKTASLTVLRSPIYAHHEPYLPKEELEYVYVDQGVQHFTYGLYPHDGSFEETPAIKRAKELCCPPIALFETYHKGELNQSGSFLKIGAENIIVEAVKEAEDGSGELIVRAYETAGKDTVTKMSLPFLGVEAEITVMPFEVQTLRIGDDKKVSIVTMLEEESHSHLTSIL